MRRLLSALALLLVFVSPFAQGNRLVIVSWDGAADWYLDKMIDAGKLPTLKKMKEKGVYADSVIPCNPSITAAGHASIWTGTWPDKHNISGNTVPLLPRAEHTLNESTRGFDSKCLNAQPLWMSAALAGKSVCILSATHSYPSDTWTEKLKAASIPLTNYMSFSGFETTLFGPNVYTEANSPKDAERFGRSGKELELKVGENNFVAFFAKGTDGTYSDCTIFRAKDGKADFAAYMRADTSPFSNPVDVHKGEDWGLMTFTLLDIAPDLSHFVLYQGSSSCIKGYSDKIVGEDYVRTAGGFHDLPVSLYESGKLGKTAWQGGDGVAEQRLLRIIERDFGRLTDGFKWAVRHGSPNLIMHYTSAIDSLGHSLMGVLDPDSPKYNKDWAAKLTPLYDGAIILADKWLGEIIDAAGPTAIVALVSDHGMEGSGKQVSLNRILVDAGLAAVTDGKLDVAKSKVISPSWNYFLVNVNGTDWKNGVVSDSDRAAVVDSAIKAFTACKDPVTGSPVILKAMRASDVAGGAGPCGGDIYVEFAPGYHPTSRLLPQAVADDEDVIGSGNHGFTPDRLKMRSIFYAIGPGLSPGRNVGNIRQIDIAPSLCPLASLPTPADSIGTNLKLTQKAN